MGRGAGQCGAWLAQYRLEEIDRVGVERTAGASNDRLVVEVLVLDTGEQPVLQAQGVEVAGQVQLHIAVIPFQLALAEVAPQGAAVALQTVALHRIALQGAVQLLHPAGQRPVVIEPMLEAQLQHVVVVVQQVVAARLPDIGIARGVADLVGEAGQAAIQRMVVAHEVALQDDPCRIGELPA
ncbi:hypothetical protein D9M70_535510 [compost metagenome]